jgi:ribosome-associated translation inhibitor RaiA
MGCVVSFDETGLRGGFDFKLAEVESDNHDMLRGVDLVLDRLGLTLEKGKRRVDSLSVDAVFLPTPD